MATIQKRNTKKGISYRVLIRSKDTNSISKTFKSKSDALRFVDKIEGNSGYLTSFNSYKGFTYQELSNEYKINRYGSISNVPISYESRLRYWDKAIGSKAVNSITKAQIVTLLQKLPSHLSNSSKNKFKKAVSAVFNYGVNKDIITDSPVNRIKSLREPSGRLRYLSEDEKTRLFKACRSSQWDKLYVLVLMAITTGARKGELMNLHWSDVDFDRKVAYVKTTKNGQPKVMPLTREVIKELSRFKDQEPELIFNSEIKPNKPYEFYKLWRKVLKEAEIYDFTFHSLRHTCASYLAMNGCSLLEIADVLGHKQISMTARYSHLCVSHKQKLINKHFG